MRHLAAWTLAVVVSALAGPAAAQAPALPGAAWAVVIGINDYQHARIPKLRFAVNDARSVQRALVAQGFRPERIVAILDRDATKSRIEEVLGDDLRQRVRAEDRVLVFFAGHGITDRLRSGEEEGYLLPVDGDPARLFSTAISMTALRQISDRLPARHILYVVDACYSGYALFNRSIATDLLDEMVKKPAIQILTAGRQGDQAAEKAGHGVFTDVLLRGLGGEAFSGKNWLALEELGVWMKQRVYAESNRGQLPQFGNLSGEGQFIFVRPGGGEVAAVAPAPAPVRLPPREEPRVEPPRPAPVPAPPPMPARGDYPKKPVRLVVPFPVGGTSDLVARMVADALRDRLGQPLFIENRLGASGAIGAEYVARSAPDGYTLLLTTDVLALAPSLSRLPFDPARDFAPVTQLATVPLLLVVPASSRLTSVADLIATGRRQPLSYASAGVGTVTHLAAELLVSAAGVPLTHVPYRGTAPALADLVAGRVALAFVPAPSAQEHLKDGRLRALATAGAQRSALSPQVPTIAETVAGYEVAQWIGLLAPAGTPRDVVATLHAATAAAVLAPATRERLVALGFEPAASTPDAFASALGAEIATWGRVARGAGVRAP